MASIIISKAKILPLSFSVGFFSSLNWLAQDMIKSRTVAIIQIFLDPIKSPAHKIQLKCTQFNTQIPTPSIQNTGAALHTKYNWICKNDIVFIWALLFIKCSFHREDLWVAACIAGCGYWRWRCLQTTSEWLHPHPPLGCYGPCSLDDTLETIKGHFFLKLYGSFLMDNLWPTDHWLGTWNSNMKHGAKKCTKKSKIVTSSPWVRKNQKRSHTSNSLVQTQKRH